MASVVVASRRRRWETSDGLGRALAKAAGYFVLSYLAATLGWILIPAVALGWTPLVVTSGSMAPAINRGDVVLIEPGVSPIPGNVVAFLGSDGSPVLHRLDRINDDGTFTTKGDANPQSDSTAITDVSGVGRLLIPALGLIKLWLPEGGTVLAVFAFGALALAARRRWSSLVAAGIVVGSVLFVASAFFATTTANAGSGIAAVSIEPPTNLAATCGAISVGSDVPIDLTWTASATNGVSYQISYDAAPPGAGFVVVGSTSGTSFTYPIPAGDIALGQAHTFRVHATIATWASGAAEDQVTITRVLLVYLCS